MSIYQQGHSGYCTTAACNEPSDEPEPFPLCAYHRDHPKKG